MGPTSMLVKWMGLYQDDFTSCLAVLGFEDHYVNSYSFASFFFLLDSYHNVTPSFPLLVLVIIELCS